MSPGRHRHSPPLHKLLPPSTIAGFSLVCAVGTWFSQEPVVLRGLAAGAAAAAVVGAIAMRGWDRMAGRRVAQLERARQSDGWAHEERVAELEGDLEESRDIRSALERKLRTKRAELAALRNEHAALLRRYATAETERASALEGRRLLAIEAVPARASLASAEATSPRSVTASRTAVPGPRSAAAPGVAFGASEQGTFGASEPGRRPSAAQDRPARPAGAVPTPPVPTPSLFQRANAALDSLAKESQGSKESKKSQEFEEPEKPGGPDEPSAQETTSPTTSGGPEHQGPRADGAGSPSAPAGEGARPSDGSHTAGDESHERADGGSLRAAGGYPVPYAAAVVPPAAPVRSVPQGGFDFFGTKSATVAASLASAGPAASPSSPSAPSESPTGSPASLDTVQNEDLADVVGEEALAVHKAATEAGFKPATEAQRGVGQVIDLTAHDETEQIDVSHLRDAVS